MISSSPPNYSYLQIERSVSGGRDFLMQARAIGQKVLGQNVVTSITEFGLPDETDADEQVFGPAEIITPISEPNMVLAGEASDLKLVLLHRAVPEDTVPGINFGLQAERFRTGLAAYTRVNTEDGGWQHQHENEQSLKAELDAISQRYDQDPNNLSQSFDRVDVIGEPGKNLILGLFPQARQIGNLILHQQAKLCFERLAAQSTRLAYPNSPWSLNVPFARVAGDISAREYLRLTEGLNALLPVRFRIGGVNYSSHDPAR